MTRNGGRKLRSRSAAARVAMMVVLAALLLAVPAVDVDHEAAAHSSGSPSGPVPFSLTFKVLTLNASSPCLRWLVPGARRCPGTYPDATPPFAHTAGEMAVDGGSTGTGPLSVRFTARDAELVGTSTDGTDLVVTGGHTPTMLNLRTESQPGVAPGQPGGPLLATTTLRCYDPSCIATFTVSGYVVFDEPPYELLPFQIAFRSEDMGPSCAGIPLGALHGLCNGDFGGSPPFDDSSGYVAFSTNPGEESVHLDFHSGNDRLWGTMPNRTSHAFAVEGAEVSWGFNTHTESTGAPGTQDGPLLIIVDNLPDGRRLFTATGWLHYIPAPPHQEPPASSPAEPASAPTTPSTLPSTLPSTTATASAPTPIATQPRLTG